MPENVALASKYSQAEAFFFRGYVRHFDRIITARLSHDAMYLRERFDLRDIEKKGYKKRARKRDKKRTQ